MDGKSCQQFVEADWRGRKLTENVGWSAINPERLACPVIARRPIAAFIFDTTMSYPISRDEADLTADIHRAMDTLRNRAWPEEFGDLTNIDIRRPRRCPQTSWREQGHYFIDGQFRSGSRSAIRPSIENSDAPPGEANVADDLHVGLLTFLADGDLGLDSMDVKRSDSIRANTVDDRHPSFGYRLP